MRRRATRGLLAASALLVLTGCGGGSTGTAAPAGPAPAPKHSSAPRGAATQALSTVLQIRNNTFKSPPSVRAGDTVTVRNDDSVTHTVTADGKGGFDVVVQANSTTTFTAPDKPGSYPYHCRNHADMHGVLKVT